jgi:hypothetical protein
MYIYVYIYIYHVYVYVCTSLWIQVYTIIHDYTYTESIHLARNHLKFHRQTSSCGSAICLERLIVPLVLRHLLRFGRMHSCAIAK